MDAPAPRPPYRRITGRRSAFTLLEMLIAVAVLATIAALLVPTSSHVNDRARLNAASWILASDLEVAQILSITSPGDPVVVRFDPPNARYWLAYSSDPDEPLIRADTAEPYIVTLGEGRAATAVNVLMQTRNMSNNTVRFDPHGGLSNFNSTPAIIFRMRDNEFPQMQLTISPMTGTVSETYRKQ